MAGETQRPPSEAISDGTRAAATAAGKDSVQLLEAAPVLIWSAGLDRANDWFSPSWTSFTGRSGAELLGDGWTRSVHPEDLDRCLGIRATSF